jgi:L-seryl-tRNA(Ser) seleniumtransferase
MLGEAEEEVAARAERLRSLLASEGVAARVVSTVARVGGGALPLRELPSRAVFVPGTPAEPFGAALRAEGGEATPVVGRLEDDELLLDLRAVSEADMPALADAVLAGLRAVPRSLPQVLPREPSKVSGRTSSGSF